MLTYPRARLSDELSCSHPIRLGRDIGHKYKKGNRPAKNIGNCMSHQSRFGSQNSRSRLKHLYPIEIPSHFLALSLFRAVGKPSWAFEAPFPTQRLSIAFWVRPSLPFCSSRSFAFVARQRRARSTQYQGQLRSRQRHHVLPHRSHLLSSYGKRAQELGVFFEGWLVSVTLFCSSTYPLLLSCWCCDLVSSNRTL